MQPVLAAFKKWYASSSKQKKVLAGLGVFSLLCTGMVFMLSGTSSAQSDPLDSTPLYMLSVFVKLGGVLLLIVGGAVILRRWQKNRLNGPYNRQLKLIETVRLSPRQALHLLKVSDQYLLIGATDTTISLISGVQIAPQIVAVPAPEAQPTLDFASVLSALTSTQTATTQPTIDGD